MIIVYMRKGRFLTSSLLCWRMDPWKFITFDLLIKKLNGWHQWPGTRVTGNKKNSFSTSDLRKSPLFAPHCHPDVLAAVHALTARDPTGTPTRPLNEATVQILLAKGRCSSGRRTHPLPSPLALFLSDSSILSECFLHALSPVPEARRRVESSLSDASDHSNYGLVVLRLSPSLPLTIRSV